MITFSNKHSFQFMAASGALAFDGAGWPWEKPLRFLGLLDPSLFTVVTKTLTRQPRRGNLRWYRPFRVIKRLPNGAVNAVGLTNPGIDWWCRQVGPRISGPLIVSLEADEEKSTLEMIRKVNDFPLKGIELNMSCPNTPSEGRRKSEKMIRVCYAAKRVSQHPLLLKVSVTHDYLGLSRALNGIVEAIAINSVPWAAIFPDRPSPLALFGGGGVSGKLAQPWTWEAVKQLAQQRQVPVIGPSVWNYGDIDRLFQLGAGAVSFGSIFLYHPWRPTLFIRRWQRNHQGH